MSNRRKLPRSSLNTQVKATLGNLVVIGVAVDVSLSGLSCDFAVETPMGRPMFLSFSLEPSQAPVQLWATPVWGSQSPSGMYRVGLNFVDLAPEPYRAIADFVAKSWTEQWDPRTGRF